MIQFLAPLFLAACVVAAVPLLLHLYGKRQAKPWKFAAVEFLLRSNKQLARRFKLRRILLLSVRIAVVIAIPLILARPFSEVEAAGHADLGGVSAAVVVIDDSMSMRARLTAGGETRFARAKRLARDAIASLPPSAELALLSGSRSERVTAPRLSTDRAALLRALDDLQPGFRGTDLDAAVQRSAALLSSATAAAGASPSEKRILVVTDGAAHGFRGPAPREVSGIPIVIATTGETPAKNHAIVEARVEPAPDIGGRGARVVAVVAGSGDAEPSVQVSLKVDGKVVARGAVDLPADGGASKSRRVEKAFTLAFEPGVHEVTLEIAPDLLPEDDRRTLRVEIRRDVRVLLVDGDPRSVRREDELYYLETALRPGDDASSRMQVTAIADLGELGKRLPEADVVFLCNLKAPPPAAAALLRGFVERGGGLFLSFGDNAEPGPLAQSLGALLPQEPQVMRVEDAAPERLGRIERDHPLFQAVFDAEAQGLRSAQFRRYMMFAPAAKDPQRRTLAWLTGGAPVLLERDVGKGHVIVFASSVDRDWTDLPIRPGFLPLMQQVARYLARSPLELPESPLLIGDRKELALPEGTSDSARVEVVTPAGDVLPAARTVPGRVAFDQTLTPGFYQVKLDGAAHPELSFVVAIDPNESDLSPAPAAEEPKTATERTRTPKRKFELWHAIAACLLALMLGESLLTRRG